MANFESGVKGYVTAQYLLKVHFPIDFKDNADVNCYQCRMFNRTTGLCRITNEVSEYPSKYIGSKCPLQFDGSINEVK